MYKVADPMIEAKDIYHVDVHELSTFHNPIPYRFIVAQGYYFDEHGRRIYFTPEIKGVSTSQHLSHSIIRLSCYLAVVCGVSLRQIAWLTDKTQTLHVQAASWYVPVHNHFYIFCR